MEDRERLRAVVDAATQGEWDKVGTTVVDGRHPHGVVASASSYADAEYIATFDPPTVRALLDELDRLRDAQCRGLSIEDYERLLAWMRDPNRTEPTTGFSSGAARDAAYAFAEYIQETTDAD